MSPASLATGRRPVVAAHAASSWSNDLGQDLALWHSLGVTTVSLMASKCGDGTAVGLIRDAGLHVSTIGVSAGFELAARRSDSGGTRRIERAIELAAELGACAVHLSSGRAAGQSFEAATEALGHCLTAVAGEAARAGVGLAIETSPASRGDLGFVHTLRDACRVADQLGLGVVYDVCASWAEPGLAEVIRRNLGRIVSVQVADRPLAASPTPNRVVPGDGELPLPRLIGYLAQAGYGGPVELELIGPEIERIGYATALSRGIAFLNTMLEREYR